MDECDWRVEGSEKCECRRAAGWRSGVIWVSTLMGVEKGVRGKKE